MFRIFKNSKEKAAIQELVEKTNWKEISEMNSLSETFIETFADYLDWREIVCHSTLRMDFIRKHVNRFDLILLACHQELDEDFIREYAWNEEFLKKAIAHQPYTVEFAREFETEFRSQLGQDFLRRRNLPHERAYQEFSKSFNWWNLSRYSKLTPHFIEKYFEKFNFTSNDMEEYKIDREHYDAIRKGGWAKKDTNDFMLKSGQGIIINPMNVYYTATNCDMLNIDLWKSAD